MQEGTRPILEDCIIGPRDQWDHTKVSNLVLKYCSVEARDKLDHIRSPE